MADSRKGPKPPFPTYDIPKEPFEAPHHKPYTTPPGYRSPTMSQQWRYAYQRHPYAKYTIPVCFGLGAFIYAVGTYKMKGVGKPLDPPYHTAEDQVTERLKEEVARKKHRGMDLMQEGRTAAERAKEEVQHRAAEAEAGAKGNLSWASRKAQKTGAWAKEEAERAKEEAEQKAIAAQQDLRSRFGGK